MGRVVGVEDEAQLAQGLRFNLEAEGHSVHVTGKGEEALELLLKNKEEFDALVLDVMLPGKDGFAGARELRQAQNYIPLLMLTARARPEDVLQGFESGADDYLPKPFNLAILLARLESLLRRKNWLRNASPSGSAPAPENGSPEELNFADWGPDFRNLQFASAGQSFQLTLMHAHLLPSLINNNTRPPSRKAILQ